MTKSSATLTWEQPENNGGSPVTGYMVERKPVDSTRWTKINKKPVIDTLYTVTDLIEGTKYEFRVSAENDAGIGKPSLSTAPILAKDQFGMLLKLFMDIVGTVNHENVAQPLANLSLI